MQRLPHGGPALCPPQQLSQEAGADHPDSGDGSGRCRYEAPAADLPEAFGEYGHLIDKLIRQCYIALVRHSPYEIKNERLFPDASIRNRLSFFISHGSKLIHTL